MIIKISIVLLILISGGTLYLVDYLLKQDQKETAAQLHQSMQQTQAEAKARARAKDRFEARLRDDLANCQTTAIKAYSDYVSLIQKAAPKKRGQPVIASAILDEATKLQAGASAECRNTYDKKLREGP